MAAYVRTVCIKAERSTFLHRSDGCKNKRGMRKIKLEFGVA
jgi:hypothetical protein